MPPLSAETIRDHLESAPAKFIAGLDESSPEALRARPHAPKREALRASFDESIPVLTYSLYREFERDGSRGGYQQPLFQRNALLGQAFLAAWLYDEPGAIDRLCDLLWMKCEETTWVLPAHEGPDRPIDLVAAVTAAELAYVLHILGDRLPQEVRDRVVAEVDRRVFVPYLAMGDDLWWSHGHNNWTGVCAGSIGGAFLLLEPDTARQAQALALVIPQLNRFIENGFEDDGGCLEGVSYWNYGLSYLVSFSEMLRVRTAGAIDLLSHPKMARIARFPQVVQMDRHAFASFSDGSERFYAQPYVVAALAQRASLPTLLTLARQRASFSPRNGVLDLLWWDGTAPEAPPLHDEFLPQSGLCKLVTELGGKQAVVCAKAGHNNEPHNQNDVGSFVVHAGGVTYLCDPGAGLYSRDYFTQSERYKNVFANSYGHSVPRIAGRLQPKGDAYRGTMERLDGKGLRITMHDAYDVDELTALERTLRFEDDALVLEDVARFDGDGHEFETALVTWLPVEVDGNVARIRSDEGALRLEADSGEFAVEELEEASRANARDETLRRITVTYAPAPEVRSRIVMTLER